MVKKTPSALATQQIIPIADIRDNLVVLQNGELRAVLKVSGINFDLYANREKEQILYAFQTFLNALDFPIQILIQSRPVNLDPYLEKLKTLAPQQPTDALRIETYEYINFIQQLGRLGTLMDKSFYVIIGYAPIPIHPKSIWQKLSFQISGPPQEIVLRRYKEAKRKLFERTKVAASGLAGIGLQVAQLTNPELIELFFSCYNPGAQVRNGEALEDLESIWTSLKKNNEKTR
ncbi:hypothetical protein J7K05_00555 [bacterium]|nr:hypothetical protein [bacterium]